MNKHWLIVALVAGLLACSNAEERKAAYLDKAKSLQAQGQHDKARLEYKNALQIDPKDPETWFRLGLLEEQAQNIRTAAAIFQRVVEMDKTRNDARLKLGRLYIVGGAPDQVEPLLTEVMKTDPDNVDVLVLRAALAAHNNDIPAAQRDVSTVLQRQPEHLDATVLSATLDMRAGRADEAIARLNKAIAQHPKNTGLHAVLAAIYARQGNIDEGAAHIKAIIAIEPEVASHRVRLAEYYAVNKRPKEAEQVLHEGLKQPALKKEMQLALVNMQTAQGKSDEAMQTLTQFIKESPDNYALRFRMAELDLAARRPEQARAVYQEIIEAAGTKPDGLRARTQLARLLIAQGQSAPAGELLTEVLEQSPRDNDALIARAGLALARRDAPAAINDLRAVLRDQPNSVPVLRALANAHRQQGEMDLAVEALKKAVEAAPKDGDTRVSLAGLLAEQGKRTNAQEQLDRVLEQNPNHLGALEASFRLKAAQSNYADAMRLAQRIETQQAARGEYYQGVVLQAQKKHDEAIAHFETALKQAPGASEPLTALVKSRLALNQPALAEQRLAQELARDKENVIVQNLLGEVLLMEKKTDQAIAALRNAQRLDPKFTVPYHTLATAYLAKGDAEAAVAALRQGISATDHDPMLVYALANYQEKRGQADQAIALYEKALQARPNEVAFTNNLVMLIANYRQDKQDLERAVALGERLKGQSNPAYLDTLGWVYYRSGNVAAAVPVLEQATRQAPDSPLLNYHLGMVYYKKGDHDAARRHLERAVTDKGSYHGVEEAKATLAKLASS